MGSANHGNEKELSGWLRLAIISALEAGKKILEIYHADFTIETKEDLSPLTAADLAAHHILSRDLLATGLPVISEEGNPVSYEERRHWDRLWMIDPLDGTKEFISRNGEFTVNIALIENQTPVMGVIYAPVKDILYYALDQSGAYKMEHASLKLTPGRSPEKVFECLTDQAERLPLPGAKNHFVAVCSRRHTNQETLDFIQKLHPLNDEINYISCGSSLKLCAIAEGTADLYPRLAPTMEWDTAAGQAIVEISGGKVLDAQQLQPLVYNKQQLLNPSFFAARKSSATLDPLNNIL